MKILFSAVQAKITLATRRTRGGGSSGLAYETPWRIQKRKDVKGLSSLTDKSKLSPLVACRDSQNTVYSVHS